MENRFEASFKSLSKQRTNGKVSTGSNGHSSSKSFSISRSAFTSGSLSVEDRILVVLIENGGVDLGIPDLVDKLFSALDVSSFLPDFVKKQVVEFLRSKIKEFTDNLIETAELALNRYNSAAPGHFKNVIVLRNGSATYQDLKSTLTRLSGENKIMDILILTHGGNDSIAVNGDINGQKIKDIRKEYGKPLTIRSVYMMNCVGSSLNQAWLDAGAKVSSGSIRNNYLPEPTTYFFWNNWKGGQNFESAVTSAYRKTINLMNTAVKTILGSIPLLSDYADSFDFENFDFVKDSAPVIQGLRSVTISTDDLSFSQSQSVSSLATTVLPVSLLQSLQVSKSFANEKTQTMSLSDQGIDLIKKFEGFKPKPYNDPAGHCTIGYGTLLHKGKCDEKDANEKNFAGGINEEQATKLLLEKANEFQRTINNSVTVEMNQNQYDSLVSFVYNIGSGSFLKSTLLKELNKGNYDAVPAEMKRWKYASVDGQKVVLPGLEKRRNEEAALFTNTVSVAKSFSANNYSRPFYDTGEHAIAGEFINDAVSGPLASVRPLLPTTTFLINGVPFTYGQIITMGDFYLDFDKFNSADPNELRRLKPLIERSENHYKHTILGIGKAVSDDIDWGGPGGIGSRYIDLALSNHSHFAPPPHGSTTTTHNNKQSWELYHKKAIEKARSGSADQLDAAYPINAFGDHFLTDAFSAGHLVNKEYVINRFIKNVLVNGKVNSAADTMFEKVADAALAIPAINSKLGRFEVISPEWYMPNWDLNDTGWHVPEVFYRLLVKIVEEPKVGTQKIANLAVKAVHDYLNSYSANGVKGVPVKSNNGKNSWKLTGDGTLDLENIKMLQLAVKQSAENIEDAFKNPGTPVSTYFQRVWDLVPNLNDPTTAAVVNDAVNTYTNPSSDKLVEKAVSLIGDELDTLLNQLLLGGHIQCIKKNSCKTVAECERA